MIVLQLKQKKGIHYGIYSNYIIIYSMCVLYIFSRSLVKFNTFPLLSLLENKTVRKVTSLEFFIFVYVHLIPLSVRNNKLVHYFVQYKYFGSQVSCLQLDPTYMLFQFVILRDRTVLLEGTYIIF